ncbi:hypothetical protein QYF36_005397 [Acer negundo]|nr:hypothetical protein QYF36_005397 [Acer negundo]
MIDTCSIKAKEKKTEKRSQAVGKEIKGENEERQGELKKRDTKQRREKPGGRAWRRKERRREEERPGGKTESSICEEMKERKERDRRLRLWEKNQVRLWRYAPDIQGNPRFSTHLSQEYFSEF